MALYLVQHGKSLSKEQDPERSLSDEGLAEVTHIAGLAKQNGIRPALINHSGKKRAQQTAEIFASSLNPKNGVQQINEINPLDDVTIIAEQLKTEQNLMLVGHLPFMEKLASYLITGMQDKPVVKFQNAGIVCLDLHPDTHTWIIKWTLFPKIL